MTDKQKMAEYTKYKSQLDHLERSGDGNGSTAAKIRGSVFRIWNTLTPDQQREVALKYIPDSGFSS